MSILIIFSGSGAVGEKTFKVLVAKI